MEKVRKGEARVSYQLTNGWKLQRHQVEHPKGVSMTVPDDSYSIRDLIKKYAQGLDPKLTLLGEYGGHDDEVDHDDVDLAQAQRGDFAEVAEIKERARERLELLKQMSVSDEKKRATGKSAPQEREDEGIDDDDLRNEDEEEKIPQSDRKLESTKKGAKRPNSSTSPSS